MRWTPSKPGDKHGEIRTRKFFVFWPKKMPDGSKVWLETIHVKEKRIAWYYEGGSFCRYRWDIIEEII